MKKVLLPAIALAFVTALFALPASAAPSDAQRLSFFVVLDDSVASAAPVAAEHSQLFGGDVQHVYENALKGYAGTFSEARLGELLADPRVASVELDGEMSTSTTQTGATWGIDRIDQRNLPLSGTVAGTVGGSTYGVAKGVTLVAVRVLNCSGSGSTSGVTPESTG